MKFIYILLLFPINLIAQPGYRVFDFVDPNLKSFNIGLQYGGSSYFGDLTTTKESYKNFNNSFGITTKLRLNDYFFTNLDVNYYRIQAKDHIIKRNLSFRSDNFEVVNLYNFEFFNYNVFRKLERKELPISLHLFFGIGFTTNNPKTIYDGNWVNLRPLETENSNYSPISFIFPIGMGMSYALTKDFTLSLNSSYRFTSTDYLDDVSDKYADPNQLSSDLSRELMKRGSVWYGPNSKRGNPQNKDGYLITNIKMEYKIPIKINFIIVNKIKNKYR